MGPTSYAIPVRSFAGNIAACAAVGATTAWLSPLRRPRTTHAFVAASAVASGAAGAAVAYGDESERSERAGAKRAPVAVGTGLGVAAASFGVGLLGLRAQRSAEGWLAQNSNHPQLIMGALGAAAYLVIDLASKRDVLGSS